MESKLYLQRKIKKLFDSSFDLFYIPPPKYHLVAHIRRIILLCNDVKNLTSILSCCNGDKVVSSKKAYFNLIITFDVFYTPPPKYHLLVHIQLIILL